MIPFVSGVPFKYLMCHLHSGSESYPGQSLMFCFFFLNSLNHQWHQYSKGVVKKLFINLTIY